MKDSDMLEQNRRDILRHLHFTGLADAWDTIDPLPTQSGRSTIRINVDEAFAGQRLEWIEQPEASNPTQPNAPYSGDSEAMAMSLVGRGKETRPNARESAFGDDAWTGYEPSNWAWPVDPSIPAFPSSLLSKANLREVEPEPKPANPWMQAWYVSDRHDDQRCVEYYDKLPLPPHKEGWSGWLVDAAGHLFRRTLPKHRFIYLDGSERKEGAAQ